MIRICWPNLICHDEINSSGSDMHRKFRIWSKEIGPMSKLIERDWKCHYIPTFLKKIDFFNLSIYYFDLLINSFNLLTKNRSKVIKINQKEIKIRLKLWSMIQFCCWISNWSDIDDQIPTAWNPNCQRFNSGTLIA